MFYKAVILIAGPQKGTRFRPLSLDVPKPLFRVAGIPIVQHHIEALAKVKDVSEVLLLGFYPANEMSNFVREMNGIYRHLNIRYLQEYTSLGTAGGLHHFRDQIRSGNPDAFFVLNGDVCADFPLEEMSTFHHKTFKNDVGTPVATMMTTEATRQQSLNYGCVVEDKETHAMRHYVEKPSSYISTLVNCGVYIFSPAIFKILAAAFEKRQHMLSSSHIDTSGEKETMYLEKDILPSLAGTEEARVFQTTNWWSPVKTAASAIYANRHYLGLYRLRRPEMLAGNEAHSNGHDSTNGHVNKAKMIENVFLHPTATVHSTAIIGPNVSIGANVTIGEGVRIKESIILEGSIIDSHSIVMHTVIGKDARIGQWARVEGTPNDPNPNKPFAKMENNPLFNQEGKLNPSITIVGKSLVYLSYTN